MKKLLYIFLISYLLIFCSISRAFENISKKEFNSLLEDKGNLGFVLRYHNEKSPSGYEIKMPKNSPPIIADFKSLYGVLGGSRSFYEGTAFHKKHGGIDFYIEIGSPVLAAGDGKVYGVKKKDKCVGNHDVGAGHGFFRSFIEVDPALQVAGDFNILIIRREARRRANGERIAKLRRGMDQAGANVVAIANPGQPRTFKCEAMLFQCLEVRHDLAGM